MIETFQVTVPAPSGSQERTATVYLPQSYDGNRRYPVLYLFDGQTAFFDERATFGTSLRLGEILDGLGAEIIAVAVDCDEKDRLTEYAPFPFEAGKIKSEGKGALYLDWLVGVLMPLINEKYRTVRTRESTFIAGASMGGLMTVYALCRHSEVFGGGAALSPSFWVDPASSEEMIKSAKFERRVALYLDYGERELGAHGAAQRDSLTRCLSALLAQKIPFTFRLVEGGAHNEKSWRAQVPIFLRTLGLIG